MDALLEIALIIAAFAAGYFFVRLAELYEELKTK